MGSNDKFGPTLITTLLHESGQWIEGEQPIMAKSDTPQDLGSGITYARRYGLAAIVGVVQVDDDGESAMGRSAPGAAQAGKPQGNAVNANVVAQATQSRTEALRERISHEQKGIPAGRAPQTGGAAKEIREQEALREALTASSTKPLPEPKPSRVTSTYSYRNLEEAMVEQRRLIMESAPKITPFQGYDPFRDQPPQGFCRPGKIPSVKRAWCRLCYRGNTQQAILKHLPQEEWEKLDKVWTLVQEFDVEAKEGFLKELESQIEERLKSEWR
jgi:hypothetical protein